MTENVPDGYYKIRYVQSPNEDDIRFFIAKYPGFAQEKDWTTKCYKTKAGKDLVVDANELHSYHGSVASRGKDMYRTMVGITDDVKNEVVLYDAACIDMIISDAVQSMMKIEDNNEDTWAAKKAALMEQFGSSASRKIIKARRKNEVSSGGIKASLDYVMKDEEVVNTIKSELETTTGDEVDPMDDYRPPYNKDATDLREAYPLSGLISDADMAAILPLTKELIDCTSRQIDEWAASKKYISFVCERLRRLPMDKKIRERPACLLMYLQYLFTMSNLKAYDLKKKEFLPREIPQSIKKSLIEKFTIPIASQKTGRSMPQKLKDIVLVHICALCLHIEEFYIQVSDLNEDFPGKDLVHYYRILGCKLAKVDGKGAATKNNFKASLKVPLVFPKVEKRKERRRRNF